MSELRRSAHLDGYNQLPYLTGQQDKSARREFFYFNDDGQLVGVRTDDWKFVFCEQKTEGGLAVWRDPFVCLRAPMLRNQIDCNSCPAKPHHPPRIAAADRDPQLHQSVLGAGQQ